ncbi:23S rRNA (pseudouridine(1915)-N(3))-methyltransferase RlmH [Azonexus sp.]|jgi:23S rRNA (pseudouridine1915-N3)-methyltransferase|uniref:23S rRNA (pseudouridine(1915)-N(3))-methyltransferase RlmH n=1 Tax=Azonexus sp. TaxID=1872668 RepID=UPI00282DEC51|nr:23S rRNA (pseudouridine(1915)-N(3))-methyltransferase RlmH [Azonexus sp.]MDR1994185.1 23S rRNA (pseudouridine(1915)-N(3))-methyltransferase RlmH [Azonexus sp.]
MKLCVLAVGHRQPAWVSEGCAEYKKRMPRELLLSISEIKPEPRGTKTREQLLAAEKLRIREALPGGCRIVVLDEKGDDLTTLQLARRLEAWMRDGRDVALLIGGADGLDEEFKQQADDRLRLSSLTLPHGMARLLLCEQLYRAVSVLKNHPYHREG